MASGGLDGRFSDLKRIETATVRSTGKNMTNGQLDNISEDSKNVTGDLNAWKNTMKSHQKMKEQQSLGDSNLNL